MPGYEEHGESDDQEGTDSDVFVMPSNRGIDMTDPQFDPEEFMDMLTREFASIQREKLREILARNASVEYLQRHRLNGRTDVESFRRLVPVVTYEDLESDIMSLVNGKTTAPILTVDPIESFIIRYELKLFSLRCDRLCRNSYMIVLSSPEEVPKC